ncbi:MAG TPA: hypothetical protein VL100_14550 [Croceibacterium sp.]|nr:hypothetical protein [Croceibacterium sp.]
MATIASPEVTGPSPLQRDRAFFFYMALALLVTVLAGFGFFFAIGASSFNAPWWVHLHALSMATWVLLFVAQNALVYRGDVALHRKLGVFAVAWSAWIVVLGLGFTAMDVRTHRVPPFFEPNFFLVMDWLNIVVFAGLVGAAVRLRTNAGWHKRLMLGAMINLAAPAWGRLILPIVFDQRGVWLIALALLGYFGVAMLHDRRARGTVHPAYWWGAGSLIAWHALSFALAPLEPVVALTAKLAG